MKRCRLWSAAMLATSTHDTKRSEDVRARLNVISELPEAWGEALQAWRAINAEHKVRLDGGLAPSANDEYLLYQTLLGTYPLAPDADEMEVYCERIVEYMGKATKEAKVITSWTNANEAYDHAVADFVRAILHSEAFLQAFAPLQRQIAFFGQFNSLAQTLLKLTCPGVPDTYRGTEIWDFSLVDPDNRRPVDYDHLQALLAKIEASVERSGGAGGRVVGEPRRMAVSSCTRSRQHLTSDATTPACSLTRPISRSPLRERMRITYVPIREKRMATACWCVVPRLSRG